MPHAPDLLEEEDYEPIGSYAAIGNCRTVALVSRRGSIDWLCLPEYSSPSVFAALLDRRRGGRFVVRPREIKETTRRYVDGTNLLETTFRCGTGVLRLTDAMTMLAPDDALRELQPEHELLRVAECTEGEVTVDVAVDLRPDYGQGAATLRHREKLGWRCLFDGMAVHLYGDIDLRRAGEGGRALSGSAVLRAGETCRLVFSFVEDDLAVLTPLAAVHGQLEATRCQWQRWAAQCRYRGTHAESVLRSCLTLKLLAYHLSGAVIAAATTSLPEAETGERNWDYRYCWLRDASMLLQSFIDLGFDEEAEAFLSWLLHATRLTQPELRVLYDVHGGSSLEEREAPQLEGYRGIGPVRIGNAACQQVQHDIYGQVLLTALRFVEHGGQLDKADKTLLAGLGGLVRQRWREPDHGIWEIRLPPRHNTHSKLMCWVALDSLIALHRAVDLGIDEAAFLREREAIREDIERHGFNPAVNSYVGFYGSEDPDASLLLLPRYGYVPADHPRMVGTWRHIEARLSHRGLLYRYPPGGAYDGVEGEENLFVICNFWLVDYLARLGEIAPAEALFERLCDLANDLGLYAEEFELDTFKPKGNFPQAFSHEGLVTAALALERARKAVAEGGKR